MITQTERRAARQSNIELLRIVAMIIIIAHHFSVHGGFDYSNKVVSVNRLWTQFIEMGGGIGNDLFILISGYFLVSAQSIKTSKLLKLWIQIFCYSVGIYAVFLVFGNGSFAVKDFLKAIAPVTFSKWWFASTYFVLYLLSPFINKLLNTLDRRQYTGFLLLLFFCWCIIPTLTGSYYKSNDLLWFVFLYSLSAYYRLYECSAKLTSAKLVGASAFCVIITFLSVVLFDVLGTKISFFGSHATFFYGRQKLPILVISVLLFLWFLKLDIGKSEIINGISSAMFGVYLIHDYKDVRLFLWRSLFRNASYSDSKWLIPYSLLVVGIVFVACTAIELLRIHLIEKKYMPAIEKLARRIDDKKNSLIDRLVSLADTVKML